MNCFLILFCKTNNMVGDVNMVIIAYNTRNIPEDKNFFYYNDTLSRSTIPSKYYLVHLFSDCFQTPKLVN